MSRRRQPSLRWNREHRNKIIHRFYWQAWIHAWQINNFADDGKERRVPYVCYWGEDYHTGETATMHWHVGRPSNHHLDGYDGRWPGYSTRKPNP